MFILVINIKRTLKYHFTPTKLVSKGFVNAGEDGKKRGNVNSTENQYKLLEKQHDEKCS